MAKPSEIRRALSDSPSEPGAQPDPIAHRLAEASLDRSRSPRGEDELALGEPSGSAPFVDDEEDGPPSMDDASDWEWPGPIVGVGVAAMAACAAIATRPERGPTAWLPLGALGVGLAAMSVFRLARREELSTLRPKPGEITLGLLVAAVLYASAFGVSILGRAGDDVHRWILEMYLALTETPTRWLGLWCAGAAVLEELIFRGWVMPACVSRWGDARGWAISLGAYVSLYAPLVLTLPLGGGLNPLPIAWALSVGVVVSWVRLKFDRVLPCLATHAILSWAMVEFPLYAL